ncbi:MerR family DNA-binding protein [Streptomyces sp. NPDC057249]|uniref:MerR family DNA-binding protein n=1 Tax=Streptomyces sp. NPDC057249 TaxID=3346067 RepID=UPI0036368F58
MERLAFISSAKLLGLALKEIRELLGLREEGVCASVRARMLPLVAGRIAETNRRVAELRAFSAHLASVHADLSVPAPAGACGRDCGCTTPGPGAAAGLVPILLSPALLSQEPQPWRDAPVACTLGGAELGEQTEQWRRLVGKAEQREEIDDGVRLSFPGGRAGRRGRRARSGGAGLLRLLRLPSAPDPDRPPAGGAGARVRRRDAGRPLRSHRMTASSPRRFRPWGTLGVGAAATAACALCCAGPILAVLGGIGVTSALGALWMPAIAVWPWPPGSVSSWYGTGRPGDAHPGPAT